MSDSRGDPANSLRPAPRHTSKHSVDTNASGIAESAISFSQFPPPPLEIPTTPLRSGFGPGSPVSAKFSPVHPLRPQRKQTPARPGFDEGSSARSFTSAAGSTVSQPPPVPSNVRGMSPHDWHDGSSSIDMDPTESRLLPTSLITSLLEENRNLRRAVRGSYTSDAFSGISEMTYPPPPPDPHMARPPMPAPYRGQPIRNAPPSAFNPPSASAVHRASADSATLQGQPGVIQRRHGGGQEPVVVGIATATLHSVAGSSRPPSSQTVPMSIDEKSARYGFTGHDMDDDSILRYKATGGYPSHPPPSEDPPPQARPRLRHNPQPSTQARQSTYSVAPSFVSRISLPASVRRMLRLRKKPLPPVPRIPDIPIAVERATQRAEEAAPLPDLASRAHALHNMLEKGYHPHNSIQGYHEVAPFPVTPMSPPTPFQDNPMENAGQYQDLRPLYYRDFHHQDSSNKSGTLEFSNHGAPPKRFSCLPLSKRAKVVVGVLVLAVITAIVVAVAVTVTRKKTGSACTPGLAGAACNLNSTCVCTSESRCNALAQNILDLIPSVNEAFASNFSSNDVYNSLWYMQGSPSGNDCAPQSLLVDVGSGLNEESHRQRTQWARTALLWNAIQTQDPEESEKLRQFVQRAPWRDLPKDDLPTTMKEDAFKGTFSGYVFNFATQTVSQPSASFKDKGQPTNDQISRVESTVAISALDRAYTLAQASAIQQSTALKNYWTTTLSQKADDLRVFKARLSVAPILLPFNASNPSIGDLFSNSSTISFPPPLSCYPRLSSRQFDQINSFESDVFQLPSATAASNFTEACFPDRPVYGVLDVLRLRLPFLDASRPRQAVALRADVVPRAAIYVGDLLGATFSNANSTESHDVPRDARKVGTLSSSDHVLLQYLTSIPVETAVELVKFVLASGDRIPVPPDPSSLLFSSLQSIPPLEVAVFGDILSSDISGTVSSLNASSQALFFGTPEGETFRRWSIASRHGVSWAQNATSPLIVKDITFDDETLNDAWEATSAALRQNVAGIEKQLLDSFASTGKLTAG